MSNQNSKAERGSIIATILEVLKDGDKYGYEIIKQVEEKTGVVLKQPSLYSCLSRLENQGIITSYWTDSDIGGRRHYYKYVNMPIEHLQEKTEIVKEDSLTLPELEVITTPIISNKADKLVEIQENISLAEINNPIHLNISNEEIKQETFEQTENIEQDICDKNDLNANSEEKLNSILVLKNFLEKQTDSNIKLISFLKNKIKAHKEMLKIQEEEENEQFSLTTPPEEIKNESNYKNILGDILYEKETITPNQQIVETTSDFAQQAFNFDDNGIIVENEKKYVNNVLLKTATKTNKSTHNVTNSNKHVIEHYTNIGDLKSAFLSKNIDVKEYFYINYKNLNNKRYISTKNYLNFTLIQLIIFIATTILLENYNIESLPTFNFVSSYYFYLSVISFITLLTVFITKTVKKSAYFKFNIFIQSLVTIINCVLSILFVCKFNISNIPTLDASLLIMLIPILFIFISLIFSKKAEKF